MRRFVILLGLGPITVLLHGYPIIVLDYSFDHVVNLS